MQKDWKYRGIFAPVLTPYKENGEIDYDSLCKMVDFTIDCGCHGIVTTANAAEFDALSDEEHHETIRVIVNQTNGRVPVVAGAAGWSIRHSIANAKYAQDLGVDAVMATAPVIKPTGWETVREFYHQLDAALGVPIVIQNAPPFGPEMSPAQMFQLMDECRNIMYVKEESATEINYVGQLAEQGPKVVPDKFKGVMSGNSGLTIIDCYRRGSCGCMPANHYPDVFVKIWDLLEAGKFDEAYAIHEDIAPLMLVEGMYWMPFFYYVLYRRGIFKTDYYRGRAPRMTEKTYRQVDRLLKLAEQHYVIK